MRNSGLVKDILAMTLAIKYSWWLADSTNQDWQRLSYVITIKYVAGWRTSPRARSNYFSFTFTKVTARNSEWFPLSDSLSLICLIGFHSKMTDTLSNPFLLQINQGIINGTCPVRMNRLPTKSGAFWGVQYWWEWNTTATSPQICLFTSTKAIAGQWLGNSFC